MDALKERLEAVLNETIVDNVYGTGRIRTLSGKTYFLKSGYPSSTYACEANGLAELAKAHALPVARVVSADSDYLLTEFIERGTPSDTFYEDFGRCFARLHHYHADHFGFYEDNYIGANPQLNIPSGEEKDNWAGFFFNKRILFQFKMAEQRGYNTPVIRSGISKLEIRIEKIFQAAEEPPSLLHGDLWSGNYLCDVNGRAVLIDPAVYYGHREADLAMTNVFGSFPPAFYRAYMKEYPLTEGWEYRQGIYKLYHILNHLNIFGNSYLSEAEYLCSRI